MAAAMLATIPTGPYINGYLAIPFLIILLIWARLLTWIDKDAPAVHLPRQIMNAGTWGGFVAGVFLFLMLPLGPIGGFSILLGILIVEMGVYLGLRHQKVGLGDLTAQFKGMMQSKGKKEKKQAKAAAGQIVIVNQAGVPMPAPDPQVPERAQFDAAQLVLRDPLKRGAECIDLTVNNDGGAVTYMVDGFQYDGPSLDRNGGAGAISFFKFVAGLDPTEKRKPQVGPFKTILDNVKREMQFRTRGSSSTESMTIISEPKKRHGFTLGALGFSPEQLETVKATIQDAQGLVLITAPPGHGLTAMEYAILRAHDAFLQHILTIERNPEQEIEGVTQNTLPTSATPQEEAKQVNWVVSQEPDVVLMATVEDSNAARDLAGYAENPNKRAYVGVRAGSAFDALKQWRKLVGDDNMAIKSLRLVIAGRTLRKLCEACKVAYTPDPTLLKKLNMDPGRVKQLYQARSSPQRDAKGNSVPCTFCSDLAFKGRTGVFELLVIDDRMRELLLNNASDNEIKAAFRHQKGQYLQEMALDLVEKGETSVNEVQRVMRADQPSQSRPPADSGGGQTQSTKPSGGQPKPPKATSSRQR
jgi:type II secretory ATPase GspE/PulE/Tfp pilus assembly ATPase PilB-like protein